MNFHALNIFVTIRLKFYAALIQFALLLPIISYPAEEKMPRTNLEILDSLATETAELFCSKLNQMEIDSAVLKIGEHPAKEFLLNKILQKCMVKFYLADSLTMLPAIEITIDNYSAAYSLPSSGRDSLQREVRVSFSSYVKNKYGRIEALPIISNSYRDVIAREDIDFIKNTAYNFTNPPAPEAKRSFFEEFAEPFVIVGTAAVIVILLFTIRSE